MISKILKILRAGWQSLVTFFLAGAAALVHNLFIGERYPLAFSSVGAAGVTAVVIAVINYNNQRHDVLNSAATRILNRISDFEPLTWPDTSRSVFWNDAFSKQSIKPRQEWDWYKQEKQLNLSAEINQLKADLQRAQEQGHAALARNVFVRFCSTARSLGAFIERFGKYFDLGQGEVHMDYEVRGWFNDVIVAEYNNFVDRLQEDARELRNLLGDSVKMSAESVVKTHRLTV